jgi:ubiquinone/menaquinone biosynthesis C-methylase UbiE
VDRAAYDEIADWYDEIVRTGPQSLHNDFVIPAVLEAAGDIKEWRVCDLACGQGVISRGLAERGTSVVGVDISERLLDIARRYEREAPLGVPYVLDDARTLDWLESATFDGVVCNMALMDIHDLAACLGSVARILRLEGWFVFSITHPCFLPPNSPRWTHEKDGTISLKVSRYFEEGFWRSSNPEGVRGRLSPTIAPLVRTSTH